MKFLKIFIGILTTGLLLISTSKVFATDDPSNILSLQKQLTQEIKTVFDKPVGISYSSVNLNGTAYVKIGVNPEGKLVIMSLKGDNETLNRYIEYKIDNKSIWTSDKYAGISFDYIVNFKN
jgi:hypothetical protein